MRLGIKYALLGLLGLSLTACVSRGEIEAIKENQKEILSKLEDMDGGGGGRKRAKKRKKRKRPDPNKVYSFPVGESPVKGPEEAWVTIVEVSDFQCPFCNRVQSTLDQIQERYGDDVRLVFKHNPLPFHNRAMPAAIASECAHDQGKFWEMHDKLFANQRQLSDSNLEKFAKEIGLNVKQWKKCYEADKHKNDIVKDQRRAASLGARGTPSFFINGRYLSGAQPFPSFQNVIDEELKKAKDSGVDKGDYYAKQVVAKGEKKL